MTPPPATRSPAPHFCHTILLHAPATSHAQRMLQATVEREGGAEAATRQAGDEGGRQRSASQPRHHAPANSRRLQPFTSSHHSRHHARSTAATHCCRSLLPLAPTAPAAIQLHCMPLLPLPPPTPHSATLQHTAMHCTMQHRALSSAQRQPPPHTHTPSALSSLLSSPLLSSPLPTTRRRR